MGVGGWGNGVLVRVVIAAHSLRSLSGSKHIMKKCMMVFPATGRDSGFHTEISGLLVVLAG